MRSENHNGRTIYETSGPKTEPKANIKPSRRSRKAIVGLDVIQIPPWGDEYYPQPTKAVKKQVRSRDHYTCQLCGRPYSRCVDHIIPLTISHDSSPSNLRTVCYRCNTKNRRTRCDARLPYDEWLKLLKEQVAKDKAGVQQ